jgi:thiol-disulfide isomerase/thioredoxin
MNIKYFTSLLFTAIISLGCNGCAAELEVETSVPEVDLVTWDECGYNVGDHMCNFSLVDQNGDEFHLYDYIGKPIVLDYSTIWCGYCQVAAQDVEQTQLDNASSELLYVTILIENQSGAPPSITDCENWSSIFGIISAPVLGGSRDLIDTSGETGVPVSGWPTFLFLDKEMIIKDVLRGYSKESLDYKIQSLIMD